MSIQILNELIQIYTNMSGNGTGGVRIVAFLLYEVEHLFPSEIARRDKLVNIAIARRNESGTYSSIQLLSIPALS